MTRRVYLTAAFCSLLLASGAAAQTLPSGWATRDIGSVGRSGSASGASGSFILDGAGADVWGTADAFRFAYTTLTGDGSITARVSSVEAVNVWTKAGVMMRETLTVGSKHVFMLASPGKGIAFQRRTSTGGTSAHTSAGLGAAPVYVRLTRTGTTFRAYKSTDGSTWTLVGSITMNVTPTIYVGLAVGSHVYGALATAAFDQTAVSVSTSTSTSGSTTTITPPPPPPTTTTTTTTTATGTAVSGTLRVLHWNVHHGGVRTDGVYDPTGLAAWIAKFNPDIVTLNEVDYTSQANAILNAVKARMPGVPWTYYFLGDLKGNMIMTRLSVKSKSMCLVNSVDDRRVAHMSVAVGSRTVNIWDAHLSLDSSAERTGETRAIQGCEVNWAEARIVAGDFNMQADTAEYKSMVEKHIDAWRAAKALGTAYNYAGNCDGCTRNSRIDFIFTSTGATWLPLKSVQIFDTRNSSGVMPSDHKPMLAIYSVN